MQKFNVFRKTNVQAK